ncbi:MAG: hypothetical protein KJO77_02845 [Bacteroidia bacterium]|nr:hypothetical protein [Bacteroidia bacterium]NND53172.1 hypothetical protein [Flavobacteriaceae bacterium]
MSFLFGLMFCLGISSLFSQNAKLLGTWESKDKDEPVQMILDERGFITFRASGQLMGGVGYNIDGERLRMTYRTHQEDSKLKITITIRDLIKKRILKRDTGTIVFTDPNNIQICFKKTIQESTNTFSNDCRYFLKIM